MYQKISQELIFDKKRNRQLITPCCNKQNKDGKFVNFKGHSNIYGYCHSCGTTRKPPSLYSDEKGNYYHWNTVIQKFEPVSQFPKLNVIPNRKNCDTSYYDNSTHKLKVKKYVDFEIVKKTLKTNQENTLLQYLRSKYEDHKVNFVKQLYYIGTSKKRGTVFWFINKEGKAQKVKVSYYTEKGKRTNRFKVPYTNADGFLNCLYGEHLLTDNTSPIILVESEKTAIVASIEFPEYTWLSYSGINGLTDSKLKVLKNERIIIVPDISENAVKIINKKLSKFRQFNIDATIYDMTSGKSDRTLKETNWYNCDIEDILRKSLI